MYPSKVPARLSRGARSRERNARFVGDLVGRPSEDPSTFRNTTHVPYRAINSCDIMIYPPAPNRSDALAAGNPLASFG